MKPGKYLVMEYKQTNTQVGPGIDQLEYANLIKMKVAFFIRDKWI